MAEFHVNHKVCMPPSLPPNTLIYVPVLPPSCLADIFFADASIHPHPQSPLPPPLGPPLQSVFREREGYLWLVLPLRCCAGVYMVCTLGELETIGKADCC